VVEQSNQRWSRGPTKQIDRCPDVRQTEGFVRSILTLMRAGLDAPDHTTLSRRRQLLDVAVHTSRPQERCI